MNRAACIGLFSWLCVLPATAAPADGWTPVASAELERTRGGFATDRGLHMSLGIERLVTINGDLVTRTRISVPDMEQMTPAQASGLRDTLATHVIQNGPHNSILGAWAQAGQGGVVIQNSLNGQVIRHQTVISANVNSASVLKGLNFASSLNDALQRAIGSP